MFLFICWFVGAKRKRPLSLADENVSTAKSGGPAKKPSNLGKLSAAVASAELDPATKRQRRTTAVAGSKQLTNDSTPASVLFADVRSCGKGVGVKGRQTAKDDRGATPDCKL